MILSADGLRLAFGGRTVLDGFSVTLEPGDQRALTGRSGSGKTTLLLVLAGLLAPDAGVVRREVDLREVVYVPQAPSLVPELSAVQNASLGLRVRGLEPSEAELRARAQLRALGLTDCDDALPDQLSGGMQQRVALARALAVRPRLLLADEPTGALDRTTGALVLDVLRRQTAATGGALLVATHDSAAAETFDSQLQLGRERVS